MLSDTTLHETARQAIQSSHHLLSTEQDLSPHNGKITETLTHLVRTLTCCQCSSLSDCLLAEQCLQREKEQLPDLCGKAECEMEKYWARRLIASAAPDINEFWYIAEYRALCEAEAALLAGKKFDYLSFLGAGALPLTAIFMAQHVDAKKVICVDFDPVACDLSRALVKKLGLDNKIEVLCMDAALYQPHEKELVMCASLLQNSAAVYANIARHHEDCDLLVRDAEGAYKFLYRPAILPKAPFREISRTSIDAKRINTTHYYRAQRNEEQPDVAAA